MKKIMILFFVLMCGAGNAQTNTQVKKLSPQLISDLQFVYFYELDLDLTQLTFEEQRVFSLFLRAESKKRKSIKRFKSFIIRLEDQGRTED